MIGIPVLYVCIGTNCRRLFLFHLFCLLQLDDLLLDDPALSRQGMRSRTKWAPANSADKTSLSSLTVFPPVEHRSQSPDRDKVCQIPGFPVVGLCGHRALDSRPRHWLIQYPQRRSSASRLHPPADLGILGGLISAFTEVWQ